MNKFDKRLNEFHECLVETKVTTSNEDFVDLEQSILETTGYLTQLKNNNLYIIGNGGSAGVASHAANDFINMCNIKASTFHDISIMTCLTNDYGYDEAYRILIEKFSQPNDILIAISSSGNSENIINASKKFKELYPSNILITLSGFSDDNKLRKIGDQNYWIDSKSYGIVEIGHQFLLHNFSDRICGKV